MKLFSIFDSKAGSFDKPFSLKTKVDAIRGWQELANDSKTMIGKHPADFSLFEIAEFDDLTGQIKVYEAKVNLGTALEFQNART